MGSQTVRAAECDTCTCTDTLPSTVTTLKQQPQICYLNRMFGSCRSFEQKPSWVGRNKCLMFIHLYSLFCHCPLLVIIDLLLVLSLLPTATKSCVILWTAALHWMRENFLLDVLLLKTTFLLLKPFPDLYLKSASSCENGSLYPLIYRGMYK